MFTCGAALTYRADGAGMKAPPAGEAIAIPEAEAVNRDVQTAEDLFKDGSLL